MKFLAMNLFLLSIMITPLSYAGEFGDYKSSTLTVKAWTALNKQKYELAIMFADKCIELYAKEAKAMQASLTSVPQGETNVIHEKYWALNDVSTVHFIKIKALVALERKAEAKETLTTLMNEYSFGQCYDPRGGWFWVPAEGALSEYATLLEE